jgi:AcrR family transcriptional regulator
MLDSQQSSKNCIKDALIDLMLMMDVDKITAANLARKAGISRATLYRHYDSVDDVLREMEDEFLEGMRDCSRLYISAPFNTRYLDKPYPAFVDITEYIYRHKCFFLAMTGPHGDRRFVYKLHRIIREFYIGKLAHEELVRENMDVYVEFFLAAHDAVIRYWIEKRPDISLEKFTSIVQRILFGPFVCQPKS